MYQLILMIHIIIGICLIALVLVQQGRGATMGAAFGSGASQTVFGSRGSGSFLLRVTIGFVIIFFGTSIALNYLTTKSVSAEKHAPLPIPMQQDGADKISPSNIPMSGGLLPAEKSKK